MQRSHCVGFALAPLLAPMTAAQQIHYDEARVPAYTLPAALVFESGEKVTDAEGWRRRRAELIAGFEEHVYGVTPRRAIVLSYEVTDTDEEALGGAATRRQVTLKFSEDEGAPELDLLIWVPNDAERPCPAFLGLNFFGNHSIHPDPKIALARSWLGDDAELGVVEHRATEAGRGKRAHRWPVETIVARGYALITANYGDIDPDFDDGFQNGVHGWLEELEGPGGPRAADAWGSIGAWAWGLSRALDYLEVDPLVDASRVAVFGHSRLGKTALWAGAQDERFALVISNESGCGGAALWRRSFGETLERITRVFPHWFCDRLEDYAGREGELPLDQHMLVALAAPRPVYVASAVLDRWADPRGEFLAAKGAAPVYELLGLEGLGVDQMPGVDEPVGQTIGYHVRRGEHDLTVWDWEQFLDFADRHLAAPK